MSHMVDETYKRCMVNINELISIAERIDSVIVEEIKARKREMLEAYEEFVMEG